MVIGRALDQYPYARRRFEGNDELIVAVGPDEAVAPGDTDQESDRSRTTPSLYTRRRAGRVP